MSFGNLKLQFASRPPLTRPIICQGFEVRVIDPGLSQDEMTSAMSQEQQAELEDARAKLIQDLGCPNYFQHVNEHLPTAIEACARATRVLNEVLNRLPDRNEFRESAAKVNINLAFLHADNGGLDLSKLACQRVLALLADCSANTEPLPECFQSLRFMAYDWLCKVCLATGEFPEALANFRIATNMRRELAESQPSSRTQWIALAAQCLEFILGSVLTTGRALPEYEEVYQRAIDALQRAKDIEPPPSKQESTNAALEMITTFYGESFAMAFSVGASSGLPDDVTKLMAITYCELALYYENASKLGEAANYFMLARSHFQEVYTSNPDDLDSQSRLAACLNHLGLLLLTSQQYNFAEPCFVDALKLRDGLRKKVRNDIDNDTYRAGTLCNLGTVAHKQTNYDVAAQRYRQAEKDLKRVLKQAPQHAVAKEFAQNVEMAQRALTEDRGRTSL